MRHPFHKKGKPVDYNARRPSVGINWPSYTGTATLAGTSSDGITTVYYDASLGASARYNAQGLISLAPTVNTYCNQIFAAPAKKVNVIIFALGGQTDGTGGADHMGCDFSTGQNIEVCAAFGNDKMVAALYAAEMSEDYMNNSLCGLSTGEVISRWVAESIEPGVLDAFASAPVWQQDGYPNYVDVTENTDQDYDSIGCGMAFVSWMIHEKGLTLAQISQRTVGLGDGATFASVYNSLTGSSGSPWNTFLAAAKSLGAINNDDPFANVSPTPVPVPTPTPVPTPVPGVTYSNWLNELAAFIAANPAKPDSMAIDPRR